MLLEAQYVQPRKYAFLLRQFLSRANISRQYDKQSQRSGEICGNMTFSILQYEIGTTLAYKRLFTTWAQLLQESLGTAS